MNKDVLTQIEKYLLPQEFWVVSYSRNGTDHQTLGYFKNKISAINCTVKNTYNPSYTTEKLKNKFDHDGFYIYEKMGIMITISKTKFND